MSSRRESDFARLKQLLREADERAEQERLRADEERLRAEKEQRTRQEAERKITPTTFKEYIRSCHILLSKPLRVQTDKSASTQGSITNTKNKPCPTLLQPWTDFPILQQELFERVYGYFPQDAEYFSST